MRMISDRHDRVAAATALAALGALSLTSLARAGLGATVQAVAVMLAVVVVVAAQCRWRLTSRRAAAARDLAVDSVHATMAEELAEVGRWSIELGTGRHRWSRAMCDILGLPPETAPGAFVLRRGLAQGLSQLDVTLVAHAQDHESFAVEFEFDSPRKGPLVLRARARNIFDDAGVREHVFMVVRDVTECYRQVALAREEQAAAERDAKAARQLASTDPLTGLANRRAAMDALDQAVMASRQSGVPLGLILFDVDHFKAVNDRHGHAAGDAVLGEIGRIAARSRHDGQTAARIGGEEFLLLMPGARGEAVAGAAERLREAIETGTRQAAIPTVTASVGHAMLQPGDTGLILFARADRALYEAKRAGRNRVAEVA